MLNIVAATTRPESLAAFLRALAQSGQVDLKVVASGQEALSVASRNAPHLVVIDVELPDIEPLGLVQKLLMTNALINTAVVSPLDEEEFHEQSEGLGILGRLPLEPEAQDAQALVMKLRRIMGLGG